MTNKHKSINLKFTPRDIGRGEWGKQFYISTFRFPLEQAQQFERRAKAMGFTMSSLVNQLVMVFNETVPGPKGKVVLDRTAEPTIWGGAAKRATKRKQPAVKVAKPAAKRGNVVKVVKKSQTTNVSDALARAKAKAKLLKLRKEEAA